MAERAADQAWRNRNLVETNTGFEPGPGGCYADGNAELRQDLVDSGVFGIGQDDLLVLAEAASAAPPSWP